MAWKRFSMNLSSVELLHVKSLSGLGSFKCISLEERLKLFCFPLSTVFSNESGAGPGRNVCGF